ncbi:MAG: HPr family phosphocarrier protein [Fusobacteria bacterium]|nr:HPr family phosphocarrier protein [Fusobacteriota bacterium]
MTEKTVTIVAENGLHVRPASQLVKIAKEFEADVTITNAGKSASARSLFKMQTLAIKKGSNVTVTSEDAIAVEKVAEFLSIMD